MNGDYEAEFAATVEAAVARQLGHGTGDAIAQPPLLADMRERLINIERKIDGLSERLDSVGTVGHPDQAFGCATYAQFGEDMIILNLFHMLGVERPSYLDVGAHHPFNISNTALLHVRGSRGINVEANPNLIEAFRQHRSGDINLNVGIGPQRGELDFYFIDDRSGRNTFVRDVAEGFVRQHPDFRIQKVLPIPVLTLNDVVTEHAGGRYPDLLSLDIEGLDYDVLRTASFNVDRPTVICTEARSDALSGHVSELNALMRDKGYHVYARSVSNFIFVKTEALKKIEWISA